MSYIYLALLKQGYTVNEEVMTYLNEHHIVLLDNYESLGLIKIASSELIQNLPFFLEAIELEKHYTLEEE